MKSMYRGVLLATGLALISIPASSGYGRNGGSNRSVSIEKSAGKVVLDREFKIKNGQELTVKGQDLKVRFDSVPEDSRCPTDVKCVWEGDAKILIRVRRGHGKPANMELHTNGRFNQTGQYQNYVIKLVALNPYPKTSVKGRRRDYVATLLITKE